MKRIVISLVLLFPGVTLAATDCRVIEHPDSYEVVCVGDATAEARPDTSPKPGLQESAPAQAAPQAQATIQPATTGSLPQDDAASSRGPHVGRRVQASSMDASRAIRASIIQEQRQKESEAGRSGVAAGRGQ